MLEEYILPTEWPRGGEYFSHTKPPNFLPFPLRQPHVSSDYYVKTLQYQKKIILLYAVRN